MKKTKHKIGIITSGGDCSGLNAAIRALTFAAINKGWEVIGIHNAVNGLLARPMQYQPLSLLDFEIPYATMGGTMLGTSNTGNSHIQEKEDGTTETLTTAQLNKRFKEAVEMLGLTDLVVIGGDGSMEFIAPYCKYAGISMIGVPKTIDNDAPATDLSIGFATARTVVMEALDKLDTTAASHHRVMIAEVMGREAGHLALESGLTGYADVILIPEIPYTYENVLKRLQETRQNGRKHALMVVAEGTPKPDGKLCYNANGTLGGIGAYFEERLKKDGFNVRANVLGHMQRSGSPVALDRILASTLAARAVRVIAEGKKNRFIAIHKGGVTDYSIDYALKKKNTIVNPKSELVRVARMLGVYVGEKK